MEKNQPQNSQKQIQLRITDDILKGIYANAARISHTPEGFVVDFINVYPAEGQGVINSRVIINPQNMKLIAAAIQENLKRFEDQFGAIAQGQAQDHNFGFRTE